MMPCSMDYSQIVLIKVLTFWKYKTIKKSHFILDGFDKQSMIACNDSAETVCCSKIILVITVEIISLNGRNAEEISGNPMNPMIHGL